jgi:hypothetical protein
MPIHSWQEYGVGTVIEGLKTLIHQYPILVSGVTRRSYEDTLVMGTWHRVRTMIEGLKSLIHLLVPVDLPSGIATGVCLALLVLLVLAVKS